MTTVSSSVTHRADYAPAGLVPSVSSRNLSESERRGSLVAGAIVLGYGLVRRSFPLAALGGYLAYRGTTGRCALYESLGVSSAIGPAGLLTSFSRTVTVNRPRREIYQFFRELDDPLGALRHLHRTEEDENGTRWYLGPANGLPLRRELEVNEVRDEELIAWTSTAGARLALRYVVELEDAPSNRGTVVRVRISYVPPGGGPGAALGRVLGLLAAKRAGEDLRRMKQYFEGGEIATTRGQPAGPSFRRRLTEPIWRML